MPSGDYGLLPESPAIDSGSNPLAVGLVVDLAGGPRFWDMPGVPDSGVGPAPVVDRGCLELVVTVPPCAGDLDGNNTVNGADLAALLGNWGGSTFGDLDGDGTVTGADLAALLGRWGPC